MKSKGLDRSDTVGDTVALYLYMDTLFFLFFLFFVCVWQGRAGPGFSVYQNFGNREIYCTASNRKIMFLQWFVQDMYTTTVLPWMNLSISSQIFDDLMWILIKRVSIIVAEYIEKLFR